MRIIRRSLFVLLVVLLQVPSIGLAESPTARNSLQDRWIICTRHLPAPCGRDSVSHEMRYWRKIDDNWTRSSEEEFFSTLDRDTRLCVFVDGNRVEAHEAEYRAMTVRRKLASLPGKLRFVIWSWPSDQIHGPVRDARTKIARANAESYYLASFFTRIPTEQSTILIAYSLGTRVGTGALHLLRGGRFVSNSLGGVVSSLSPKVLLMGSAVPNCWLEPGGKLANVVPAASRILSVYNPHDRVLRLFLLEKSEDGGVVLGYRPLDTSKWGPLASKIKQVDASCVTRRFHGLNYYVNAVQSDITDYVMDDDPVEDIAPVEGIAMDRELN